MAENTNIASDEFLINPFPFYNDNADPSEFAWMNRDPVSNATIDPENPGLPKLGASPSKFGDAYTKFIYNRTPIMYIEPGRPKMFSNALNNWAMTDGEQAVKQAIINSLNEDNADGLKNAAADINELFPNDGKGGNPSRFYEFKKTWNVYRGTANTMARELANMVGVGVEQIDKYSQQEQAYQNSKSGLSYLGKEISGVSQRLMYRIERNSSMNDGFQNEIGQSELESRIDGLSNAAKEVRFLLGENDANSADRKETVDSLGKIFGAGVEGVGNVVNGLLKNVDTAIPGSKIINGAGNMLFPSIYKDSQYNPSYNIQIQLIAADGSPTCLARNIIIPLAYLMPFILPVQTTVNTYASPMLMRCTAPGWFFSDMCMVESATIERGDLAAYSKAHSMPTVLNINLTVRDLYPTMMMTLFAESGTPDGIYKMYQNNTQFSQFLMNIAGVPIMEQDDKVMQAYKTWQRVKGGFYSATSLSTWLGVASDIMTTPTTEGLGKSYHTLKSLMGRSN